MTEEFMLDSNIFDEVVDGNIEESLLIEYDATYYVTKIQRAELEDVSGDRGKELLNKFQSITDEEEPSIMTWNVEGAGWNESTWITEEQSEAYDKIQEEHAPGELKDINISAVAVADDITVVTSDKRLQNALERAYPDLVLTKEEFISKLRDD